MPFFSHPSFPLATLPRPLASVPIHFSTQTSPLGSRPVYSVASYKKLILHTLFSQNPYCSHSGSDTSILPAANTRNMDITPDSFLLPLLTTNHFRSLAVSPSKLSLKTLSQTCLLQTMSTDTTPGYRYFLPRLWQQPPNWLESTICDAARVVFQDVNRPVFAYDFLMTSIGLRITPKLPNWQISCLMDWPPPPPQSSFSPGPLSLCPALCAHAL